MATIEVKDGDPQEAIRDLLCSLFDRGLVSALLVPQEISSKKTVVQTLVHDSAGLDAASPLAPVFGVNSARIIARMCVREMAFSVDGADTVHEEETEPMAAEDVEPENKEEAEPGAGEDAEPENKEERAEAAAEGSSEAPAVEDNSSAAEQKTTPPIGVVLRPCEIRAVVELAKLQQVNMERFLVIGVDCWGTYSVNDYAEKASGDSQDSSVTADFLKQASAGDFPEDLRGACRVCQFPAATYSDLSIQLIGEDITRQIGLQAGTERGEEILKALELEETPESPEREAAIAKVKEAKKQVAEQETVDFLEVVASLCINCRNCRAVCPICYCKQCVFDGEVFEYSLDKYLNWLDRRGRLNMPPDKLLFHLTRMSHVASSCVACGQCEAACPSGIPLGRVYQRISAAAQKVLEYEAGRSLDDELPLTTFKEDELSVVES